MTPFSLLLSLAALTGALPVERQIAVLEVEVSGDVDANIGPQLTARLAELVTKRSGAHVISPDDVRAMLEHEADKQLMGCDEAGCLSELAQALGAEEVVSARVTRHEGAFALALTRLDSGSARVVARASETWTGESLLLLELLDPMVARLWAGDAEVSGALEVLGVVDGSRILVDGDVRGTAPAGQIGGLRAGAHVVRVVADGYEVFEQAVIIRPGDVKRVAVEQVAVEEPFYATWWFWTASGVGAATLAAVGGGIAAAVLLSDGGGPSGVNVSLNADKALTEGR